MSLITDPAEVERLAAEREDDNIDFRTYLKNLHWRDSRLDAVVHGIAAAVTAQIDCTACANCCKELGCSLSDGEISGMARRIDISVAEFERRYVSSDQFDQKAIRQKPRPLLEGGLCSLYEDPPEDCRSYPHLHKPGFRFRLPGRRHHLASRGSRLLMWDMKRILQHVMTWERAAGLLCLTLLVAPAVGAGNGRTDDPTKTILKTESFDRDPGWEGFNNRIVPKRIPTVTQDFGYSKTNYAGKALGELGGWISRASKSAYYADRIAPVALDEKLSAAGTFALTKTSPGGGIFFGFFRGEQPDGGGRPISSLGMDMDCERGGARLAVRLITGRNQSCGTFVTPFLPGKFRPTPIRNDGTRYQWTLDYEPEGAGGRGQFVFTLHGATPGPGEFSGANIPESYREEARRRFPDVTTFTVDLPEGYRKQGTTFDHFGLMNLTKPGGSMSIYFDDLHYLRRSQDFSTDPGWDARGNRATYKSKDVAGAQDFGFSATNHAGAKVGEVGGTFWRSGKYAYYADRVGPLSLDDRLEASGRVVLMSGAPDSDMFLGWFNDANKEDPPTRAGNFLGVHVGGPTRVGHYFQPSLTTTTGTRFQAAAGPVLTPGKVYDWSLVYDPAADGGKEAITVTLDRESVTLPLKEGVRAEGARFNRFGLFTSNIGGQIVRIYFDNLKYTAARRAP